MTFNNHLVNTSAQSEFPKNMHSQHKENIIILFIFEIEIVYLRQIHHNVLKICC